MKPVGAVLFLSSSQSSSTVNFLDGQLGDFGGDREFGLDFDKFILCVYLGHMLITSSIHYLYIVCTFNFQPFIFNSFSLACYMDGGWTC